MSEYFVGMFNPLIYVHFYSFIHSFYHSLINFKVMTFEALTEKIKSLAAAKGGIGSSIKFATDAGNVFLTADGVVSNDDSTADCTIKVSQSDLASLIGPLRESVNKHLRNWEDEGLLNFLEDGRMKIHSKLLSLN